MTQEIWTPPRAASKIIKVVETVFSAHGMPRFPLDVPAVAVEAHKIFGWSDPISKVEAANIDRFEGALFHNGDRTAWMLLYNNAIESPGRVRFTQAHELGHYVLHRLQYEGFQCGESDILVKPDEVNIESQADLFASFLLMPIDDFRRQIQGPVDLNILGQCAERYGVSLTAAVLKWLQFTDEQAIFVVSRDGFVDWAWSSESAYRAGAFIASKRSIVELQQGTLATDTTVRLEKEGREVAARAWFKYADPSLAVREMKVQLDKLDCVFSLVVLPKMSTVWPPFRGHPDV